jgi:tetratricopeptide (TPR) repeat protein
MRRMPITPVWIGLGLAAAAGAVALGLQLRAQQDASQLCREAELVLTAPLSRAPELSRIDAALALSLLERAAAIHDDARTRALLAWARALEEYQKDRPEPATRSLSEAKRGLPQRAALEVLAAAIDIQAGRPEQASSHLDAALAREPRNRRARTLAADLAADSGQPRRALELLDALIADEPEVGTLYNRRGLAQEALGDRSAAVTDFEHAAGLDPSLPQPHINLGRLLRDQGRAREAEQEFALAITRGSAEAQAWLGRGLARIARGDLEGGRGDLRQARDLARAEPGPLVALADLDVWDGKLERAIERYRAALVLADRDAIAWLKLGNALTRTRQYADARAAYEHALALEPDMAAAHNGLGAALLGQGDRAAAEQAFATAATLDSHDPNPARNLALLRRGPRAAARDRRAAQHESDARAKLD